MKFIYAIVLTAVFSVQSVATFGTARTAVGYGNKGELIWMSNSRQKAQKARDYAIVAIKHRNAVAGKEE